MMADEPKQEPKTEQQEPEWWELLSDEDQESLGAMLHTMKRRETD
jgi:hypothetical protein